jgi:hypothetical protein
MDTPARTNGFSRPFHTLQVLSWLLQIINIIGVYFTTLPLLPRNLRIAAGVSFGLLQSLVIVFGARLTKSNPTDSIVQLFHSDCDKG